MNLAIYLVDKRILFEVQVQTTKFTAGNMEELYLFIIVGFVAQLIDGSLGMAYGVTSTSFLLSLGVPPAAASASVHIAEVFTTGVSGFSHWKFDNIDWSLARRLILPGVLGGLVGAYLLTAIDGKVIKPFISSYLLVMGILVVYKVFFKKNEAKKKFRHFKSLALAGGFCDAAGGGGWGPIVTTTMLTHDHEPRQVVGSVNFTEFFVTLTQAIAFIAMLSDLQWQPITGLLLGGVVAAPLGAVIVRLIPTKWMMASIGLLIILLSGRTIMSALGYTFIF